MTTDYRKNYHLLGLEPGADWKQVRQAYKKLLNAWHPDRFHQNPRQKKIAEEKTKEITQSYKELAEYHKRFGVLPSPAREPAVSVSPEASVSPGEAESPVPGTEAPESASHTPSTTISGSWMSKRRARIIASVALVGIVYLTWRFDAPEHQDQTHLSPNDGYAHQSREPAQDRDADAAGARFMIGSSLGEVYTAQGVPTRTENDIWYYGNSKVFFVNGKVVRWEESMETPLRVALTPGAARIDNLFFGHGSTKAEVLSAQGTPDHDAGIFWDYGASRVYFEGDRVTGWQEAPLYPLRIKE